MKRRDAFCLFTFCFLLVLSVSAQNLSVRDIMAEPSIAGMRPENERLSPDGKYVVFMWNAEGKEPKDLYIVSTARGAPHKLLSPSDLRPPMPTPTNESKLNYGLIVSDDFVKSRQNQIGNLDWAPDSTKILFSQNGDLYLWNFAKTFAPPTDIMIYRTEDIRRLTRTQSAEAAARWLDNKRILFSQSGNLFVIDTENFSLVQISKEANPAAFVSVFNATPTGNGDLIAYVVSDGSKQRALFVPNYLDEFVQAPTFRRGFTEQKVLVVKADGSTDKPFEIKLPKAEGAGFIRGLDWAADNSSLVVDRIDKDTKRRQLFYVHDVGSKAEQTILITEEIDGKWIAPLSSIVETNPKDDSQILFGSERDGFNHLYLATLTRAKPEPNPTGEIRAENPTDAGFTGKVEIIQLTKGNWQVEWAKWVSGEKLVYMSTESGTASRDFARIDVPTNKREEFFGPPIKNGMLSSPQLSEDAEPMLLYSASGWNHPNELYAVRAFCDGDLPGRRFPNGCPQIRFSSVLTKTTPDAFLKRTWNEPKFIDIPSRDGKQIKSKIYLPGSFDKKKKYPMAIFVHGAGYLQNTINGWNNYYREFMFNDLLTRKGYVVLDIDYRGSSGYGRDWRTDVYDFLGGKDYEDHLDAIDFMVANYAVDASKVGVYGGSYGGFMAGMLVLRAPEKIAAAAALRPVFDWKNYFYSSPNYTAERLGFPDKNAEAYKRSSPITYAENLKKPLLILHGVVDDNVPAQDSMQMVEKLIRLEKTQYFEAMFYPAENHGFTRATSWTDEYERILMFFEKHLK
jgi:dipeptidyl aminopeptidase/acylaminoacyl peptidase